MIPKRYNSFIIVPPGYRVADLLNLARACKFVFNCWYEVSRANVSISLSGFVSSRAIRDLSFFAKPLIFPVEFRNRSYLAFTVGRNVMVSRDVLDDYSKLVEVVGHETVHWLFGIRAMTVEEHLRHPEFNPLFPITAKGPDEGWAERVRELHFHWEGDLKPPQHLE